MYYLKNNIIYILVYKNKKKKIESRIRYLDDNIRWFTHEFVPNIIIMNINIYLMFQR